MSRHRQELRSKFRIPANDLCMDDVFAAMSLDEQDSIL